MDTLQTLVIALGLASLAGLRLYLTVFMTSLAIHQGWLKLSPTYANLEVLGSDAVLIASGVLLVLEFLADKVQGFDSVWDGVHTLIRPIGATVLALQVLGDWPPEAKIIAGLCSGLVALTVHSAKAGTRLIVNTSPEPVSNMAVSAVEDIMVAGAFGLLVTNPLLGGSIIFAGVLFCLWATPRAFRMARATASLLWQRLTRFSRRDPAAELPRQLSADHDMLVAEALGEHAEVDWVVEGFSSRVRRIRGLDGNRRGLLVATASHGHTLVFIGRKLFRHARVKLPLAGFQVRRETAFLSENVVLFHRTTRQRVTFRFPRAEAPIVDRVVADLQRRLGPAETPAPTPVTATLPQAA